MSVDSCIVQALRGLTGLAKLTAATGLLGKAGSQVARYVAPGLALVADLVEGGHDPVEKIERVRADLLDGELQGIDRRWSDRQDELFSSFEDIYEGG